MLLKKIPSMILILSLLTNSIVKCDKTRYKKNLTISAYLVLCAYSIKKIQGSIEEDMFFNELKLKDTMEGFYFKTKYPKTILYSRIFNIAALVTYSFLAIFSIKNIIQELTNKNKIKDKKKQ